MLQILKILRTTFFRKILNIFWKTHTFALKKNKKFLNISTNDTALVFGNGGSLKFLNFRGLPDHIKIGCTYSLLDKRFEGKNKLDYCIFSYPYGLFPVVWSVMQNNFVTNTIGKIHKKIINQNKDVIFFHSLTNYYSYLRKPKNLFFFHNINQKKELSHNLASDFNYNSSALEIMIGLAKYIGIKKIYLLGCDYLGDPIGYGHFYSAGKLNYDLQDEFHSGEEQKKYINKIKEVSEGLKVNVVLPKNIKCSHFNVITIEKFSLHQEKYMENKEILRHEYIPLLEEGQNKNVIYYENDYKKLSGLTIEEFLEKERKGKN